MEFLLKAIGLGAPIPNFPFTAVSGEPQLVHERSGLPPWTMRPGKRDEDGMPVTIFSAKLGEADRTSGLLRRGLQRAKSLILPGVLRCYGGTEYSNVLYVATERCVPLTTVIDGPQERQYYYGDTDELYSRGVAQGLRGIGEALAALHSKALIHGNVCAESVYVTSSGFWCLWGLEFVDRLPVVDDMTVLPPYRMLPEWPNADDGCADAIDAWGLGCLVYETVGPRHGQVPVRERTAGLHTADIRNCRQIPGTLQKDYSRLCAEDPRTDFHVARFIENCNFITSSDYVQTLREVDQLAFLDAAASSSLFDRLSNAVHTFPQRATLHYVLPKLTDHVRRGAAPSTLCDVVGPVISIVRTVQDHDLFQQFVTPALVALFQSQDRSLRLRLLHHVEAFSIKVSEDTLNMELWPLYAKGFTSSIPSIREHSARSLVHVAPRLSQAIMGTEVPKLLQQLQQDPDGAIRTNATICLCLVANYIPAEQRSRVLVVGFGRMLKDPFAASRFAALQSFSANLDIMAPKQLADMIIPGVSPLTLDEEANVRGMAFIVLSKAITLLEKEHNSRPATESSNNDPISMLPTPAAPPGSQAANWGWSAWGSPLGMTTSSATSSDMSCCRSTKLTTSLSSLRSPQAIATRPEQLHTDPTPATTLGSTASSQHSFPHSRSFIDPKAVAVRSTACNPPSSTAVDDDWDSDGDMVQMLQKPVTSSSAPKFKSDAMSPAASTAPKAEPPSRGGAMKLRKKGGLGVTRLD